MKYIFVLTAIATIFLIFPHSVLAENQKFQVTSDISYYVDSTPVTKVTKNIHIKNLTTASLAKEYLLKVKGKKVNNIHAYDQSGELPVENYDIGRDTQIRIQFRKLAPGIDKTLHWTLKYEIPTLAKKVGRLWTVNLPKAELSSYEDNISVNLRTSPDLGKVVQSKPIPSGKGKSWTGQNAKKQILVSLSGDDKMPYQAYKFQLNYHLRNSSLLPETQEIALPPDTPYQKIFLKSLDPKPANVRIDSDGNWLAAYILPPSASQDIKATGYSAVFAAPRYHSGWDGSDLTKADKYWEVDSPEIRKLAQNLHTASDIYSFVTDKLSYSKYRVSKNPVRQGALLALKTPLSSICTDFSDLFIALSRAIRIPAREINGFAYTEDQSSFPLSLQKDVLHSWVEYFDAGENSWRMIDPTWGSTSGGLDYLNSFDFNHLTLAIHGKDSGSPVPAGFYKNPAKLKKFLSDAPPPKDVFISPVEIALNIEEIPGPEIISEQKNTFLQGFPTRLSFDIRNPNITATGAEVLEIKKGENELAQIKVPPIPPYGRIRLEQAVGLPVGSHNLIFESKNFRYSKLISVIPYTSPAWFLSIPKEIL